MINLGFASDLNESVSHHVPHTPALVLVGVPYGR